jgi:hypothetical protein
MKRFFTFLKDFGNGVLYLGLMAGFMLLVAAGMYYFKPHEIFADPVELAAKARQNDVELAKRLLKLGLEIAAACVALLWISGKTEALWRRRRMRQAEAEAAPAAAEAKK